MELHAPAHRLLVTVIYLFYFILPSEKRSFLPAFFFFKKQMTLREMHIRFLSNFNFLPFSFEKLGKGRGGGGAMGWDKAKPKLLFRSGMRWCDFFLT